MKHFTLLIFALIILSFESQVQCCQVLSDDKKRALYDQYGEAGVKSTVGGSSAYTVC